jgi:hypothetical protein
MQMTDPNEILLEDPLGKITRQERTRLLVSSLIGIIVAKAKVVPTEITALLTLSQ